MKTIIAGSRSITNINILLRAIRKSNIKPSLVISGGAKGVDKLGEIWANKKEVPIKIYPADWNKFGKSAGYRRNVEMANNADALIAIWDGKSKGTKHMIDIAKSKELFTYIHLTK